MNAVTVREAQLRLDQFVERVIADAEPTIVIAESGARAVILPLAEYNAWQETAYLLSNPANASHLRRSIAEAKGGQASERVLLDA